MVVLICISLMISDVEHLFISYTCWPYFREISVQVLCAYSSVFVLLFLFFAIELYELFLYWVGQKVHMVFSVK